jgi:hypothetical protein
MGHGGLQRRRIDAAQHPFRGSAHDVPVVVPEIMGWRKDVDIDQEATLPFYISS